MLPRDANMSHEHLKRLFVYDEFTGELRWSVSPGNGSVAGDLAGSLDKETGYIRVTFFGGKRALAQRIVWFWMTGAWPPSQVDHIDTNRSNNKWQNLRLATQKQNSGNANLRSDNTSGMKGVRRQFGKWIARIGIDGRVKYLGSYDCPVAASLAYQIEAHKVFGDFHRLG